MFTGGSSPEAVQRSATPSLTMYEALTPSNEARVLTTAGATGGFKIVHVNDA